MVRWPLSLLVRAWLTGMCSELKAAQQDDVGPVPLEAVMAHLKPSSNPEEIYSSISNKRLPGTGNWIREEPQFEGWVRREKPILWLYGSPGAGKSFLSTNIIQYLVDLFPQQIEDHRRISVAYFFCKEDDPDLRSLTKALRSLAYQICLNNPVYAKYCLNLFRIIPDIKSTGELWRKLFVDYFSRDSLEDSVFLVVDGLDEMSEYESQGFLELLEDTYSPTTTSAKTRVQIMMLGRPELNWDIENVLDDRIPSILVSAEKTAKDIEEYVVKSVAKAKNLRRVPKELQQEVMTTLTNGADGMFLWVDLMIKELSTKHRVEQIRQALVKPPKGLSDTIRHVLARFSNTLEEDDISDLNELLAWVVCAERQLTLGELDTIMKLRSSDGDGVIYLEGMRQAPSQHHPAH